MARVVNKNKSIVLGDRVELAKSFFRRFRGLMFSSGLPEGGGLVLEPCNSIHMFLMRFAIDVAFCSSDGSILALYHEIKPWRVSSIHWGAVRAIELPAGTFQRSSTEIGDVLIIEDE